MSGQKEEKKEKEKEEKKEEKKKEENEEKKEEEKNFLHTDGRTGQSKVVQDVLADLKNL